MTVNQYLQELICTLHQQCLKQAPFNSDHMTETDQLFIDRLRGLSEQSSAGEEHYAQGQQLISQIIGNYPHITPLMNRDLLWLLGGDALHYLSDDEMSLYQQIEDQLYEQKSGDFKAIKASVLNLH